MERLVITDAQWLRLASLLPGRVGYVGGTARDNRLFVEAVLWIARTGSPWRDLPSCFGRWNSVYIRYNRWAISGVWSRVFEALKENPDLEYIMIDSTIARAHQHSAGGKGGRRLKQWGAPKAD